MTKVRKPAKAAHTETAIAARSEHRRAVGDVYHRPVFARTRRQCLSLPGSTEALAWGHPVFKAGGKTFCAFEVIRGRPSIAFRLSEKEAAAALKDVRCFASPYGRGLWVSVWIDDSVDRGLLSTFVDHSYRMVAPKRLLAALEGHS
jgi:predicted DNA-binding protein (MmcQ/YjbR family)